MFLLTWIIEKIGGGDGIKNKNMAYVYRHIRLDKNVPFYIGIGSDITYERAFRKRRENNPHWNNIVKKTPYEVEIILDDLTWGEACKKEIEFISLYGRRDLRRGPLVNLTDGGEGVLGMVTSEKNRKATSERFGKPVAQYTLDGFFVRSFSSCLSVEKEMGWSNTSICNCANLTKKTYTAHGYVWRWYNGNNENIFFDKQNYLTNQRHSFVKINQYDKNGVYIKSFNSVNEAAGEHGCSVKNISGVLTGRHMATYNMIFRYDTGYRGNIDVTELYPSRFGEGAPAYGRKGILSGRYGIKGKDHPTSIPVAKIDKNTGEVIEFFENIRRASEKTGIDSSGISKCVRGVLKKCGGFKWRYNR